MRLGLTLRTASGNLGEAIQTATAAEREGVDTIYVVERHFDPEHGYANAFAIAAALSGRLQRAWVGVLPALGLEHPLRVVEQANLLDVLMGGRCLIVIADATHRPQYDAFGLPTPSNGLLEDLLHRMEEAWAWRFNEDGPPLELQSGPFGGRLAGRIMPTARPLLARETVTEVGVIEAARHGWAIQLWDGENVEQLVDLYRRELVSNGLPPSLVDALLDRVTVRLESLPEASKVRHLAECGVAEVRLDLEHEVALGSMMSLVKIH
jgi:alkanesulfonate monooxygenase SsuD/methylene tetrahydromethanopterin reductase-like flavin-dependent oxidoreductase (luciferase family)